MKTTLFGILSSFFTAFALFEISYADELPPERQNLRIGSAVPIAPMDLIDLHYVEEWEAYSAIFDTLFEYKVDSGISPIIAETWSFDNQNKIITFKIRHKTFGPGGFES